MIPAEKCVSLGTAKRLRDAGFPQDTERMYLLIPCGCTGHENWELIDPITTYVRRADIEIREEHKIAAPDAQEIGAMLPFRHKHLGTVNDALFVEHKLANMEKRWWIVGYVDEYTSRWPFDFLVFQGKEVRFENENEAEARAACWLYLKEQGLLK